MKRQTDIGPGDTVRLSVTESASRKGWRTPPPLSSTKSSEDTRKLQQKFMLKKLGKSQLLFTGSKFSTENVHRSHAPSRNLMSVGALLNPQAKKCVETDHYCKNHKKMPAEGTLIIQVTDTGCGISEEDQKKLFQPFAQANNKVYSEFGGTGLGLWISQKLIQAMKGTITCSSTLNKGTTFTITLPVKCKPAPSRVHSYFSCSCTSPTANNHACTIGPANVIQ